MQNDKYQVREYIAPSGKIPFRKWLDSLKDQKAKYLVDARIANMRRGTFGHYRSVGKGVYELKIDYGPGYRIYYGQEGKVIILLLCGGTKKTQSSDIKKAQQYWEESRG